MNYWKIPLSDLNYGPEEEAALLEVIHSGWLTMGQATRRFETDFASRVGAKHAVAVTNATAALHLACLCLNIGPGDEVILPSLTFVATANAVRYTGAEVRFADINGLDDLNISPAAIAAEISAGTRAIIVVHYAGYACDMEQINRMAQEHGLAVIEDAAHAPGASLKGRSLGSWGDIGCFSFFSNKNLACGEGGMLVTDRDDIAARARRLRSHGMTSLTWDRHHGHAYSYDVADLGFNYRIDEMRAALGWVQLQKLAVSNRRRRDLTHLYWSGLEGSGLGLPFIDSASDSSHHILPVVLPEETDRKALIDSLRAAGIQTSIHYPPIHKFTNFAQSFSQVQLPKTEAAARRELTLPLYPSMSEQDVDVVVQAVLTGLGA